MMPYKTICFNHSPRRSATPPHSPPGLLQGSRHIAVICRPLPGHRRGQRLHIVGGRPRLWSTYGQYVNCPRSIAAAWRRRGGTAPLCYSAILYLLPFPALGTVPRLRHMAAYVQAMHSAGTGSRKANRQQKNQGFPWVMSDNVSCVNKKYHILGHVMSK